MRARPGDVGQWISQTLLVEQDDCIIWPFAIGSRGYGKVGARTIGKTGSPWDAHRAICMLAHGEPPSDRHEAAHSCRNRACVNKKHLRWATPAENKADELIHGTRNRGERHGHAKLTREAVIAIRQSDHRPADLAWCHGVSEAAIRDILTRRTWSWL